jgi:hypothetical protein
MARLLNRVIPIGLESGKILVILCFDIEKLYSHAKV